MGHPVAFFLLPVLHKATWRPTLDEPLTTAVPQEPTWQVGQISPWGTRLATTAKHQTGQVLLPSAFDYVQRVSFLYNYPHHICSFTTLNLEVIWRRSTSRKNIRFRNEENWKVYNTPPEHPSIPGSSTIRRTARVHRHILAAWMSSFCSHQVVKGHRINTGQEEFPGS